MTRCRTFFYNTEKPSRSDSNEKHLSIIQQQKFYFVYMTSD